ncbi:MAG: sugar phosphate isomerase/epimerase [Planctomycetota bacterium]
MLRLGFGAAATWAGSGLLGCAQPERRPKPIAPSPQPQPGPGGQVARPIPIGLQLYSVREDCAKDLPAVITVVAEMGYQGVEFAGYHGRSAAELRRMLDDQGLKCCGTHIGLDAISGDTLQSTADFSLALGNRFLIVSSLPPQRLASVEGVKGAAGIFTEAAAKVRPLGLRVGYHAHAMDFQDLGGQTAWDMLFTNAGPDVVMQLDTANCMAGGGDPVAILRKFPGRSATIHLKEHGGPKGAVVGEGVVPWAEVLEICRTTGGTEWFVVEQEVYATTPLESVRACLVNLRRLLA